MLFVGIDALPQEGVAYVKQGILDATFLYPTGGAGGDRGRRSSILAGREGAEEDRPRDAPLHEGERREAAGPPIPAAGPAKDKKGAVR